MPAAEWRKNQVAGVLGELPVGGGSEPIHTWGDVVRGEQGAREQERDGEGQMVCHRMSYPL